LARADVASDDSKDVGRVCVRIRRPSPDLQPYVTFFYHVETHGPVTDFLYPEWGNVRFALSGRWAVRMAGIDDPTPHDGALFGPTDRPGRIETDGGTCTGFGMTPIGWHRLVGGDAAALTNRIQPLGKRLGFDAHVLCRALLQTRDEQAEVELMEQAIRARLTTRAPVSETVLRVDRALRGRPAEVSEFAQSIGMTERSLHRLCLSTYGFAPKRLMRLQRFLDTLGHVRSAVGARVSQTTLAGYFDQAHFYRDFRDFMGMTPRAYFSASRPVMAAAAEAQREAGVTLSFRLPPPPGEPIAPPER
jgi:AraC-like DNA-binding protein